MIKIGSLYKDSWGIKWQVIGFNEEFNKWEMLSWFNNRVSDFSTKELKNNFTLIAP